MSYSMSLQAFLTASNEVPGQPLALFALLTLGILESLAHGLLSATDALRVFSTPKIVCLSVNACVIKRLMPS